MNRKCAFEGVLNGKNLKGTNLYGNTPIYINSSFCREYKKFGWIIRSLKKKKLIDGFKVRNGINQIKLLGSERFLDISHVSDFEKYDLDVSSYLD